MPYPNLKNIINVKDQKAAKRLLTRLISQLQRGEIKSSTAKDLTYLLNNFIQISKYDFEVEKVNTLIVIVFKRFTMYWEKFFVDILDEMYDLLGQEKVDYINNKVNTIHIKVVENFPDWIKKIKKELDNDTSFNFILKAATKKDKQNLETTIITVLDYLPQKDIYDIIDKLVKRYYR